MEPSCSSGSALVAYTCKQKPSRSRSRCLLNPLNGTVSLASGQVLGTLANDCKVVNPPLSGRPATSSFVCPECCLSRDAGLTPAVNFWGGPCSGCWFLVRFSDLILWSQDNGFIQERGVVAGTRVGLVILVPVFLGALVAVFLLSWSFFGRYLGCNSVPGHGLDSCVVVWLSFFVAVLVGPFVAVLVVVLLFAFV